VEEESGSDEDGSDEDFKEWGIKDEGDDKSDTSSEPADMKHNKKRQQPSKSNRVCDVQLHVCSFIKMS
jgi:hypothetical protein